ncbi:hypothetical protein ONZ45_g8811 [Pleurotus djamor]|nr:hypothetical protein ONZ45_g8811 [Pleurotus djamor]
MAELDALVRIISSGVQTLRENYASQRESFPSLNETFVPSKLEEDPAIMAVSRLVVGAAAQLIASLRGPYDVLNEVGTGMYGPATLTVMNDNNIADLLQEAGPEGLPADVIGEKVGIKGDYIARSMRYLATRHIFREVKPNVFANNRHSSVLVKGRSFEELKTIDPLIKYDYAPFSATMNIRTADAFPGSLCLAEFMKDSQGYPAPLSMAFKDPANLFVWYQHPDRLWRARRFSVAMKASADRWSTKHFSSAIDWNALPDKSTVVDVGGNNGSVTMAIARVAPKHEYIIQDLPSVIEIGKEHWEDLWPEALRDGIARFEAHDFFTPMNIPADIYFLRSVIHDWSDEESIKILRNIRIGAKATSKLILFEMAVVPACPSQDSSSTEKTNILGAEAPYPLLGNLGLGGGGHVTISDLQMFTLIGGKERTVDDFEVLGRSAGWVLESVKPGAIAAFIFVPGEGVEAPQSQR